MKKYNNYLFIEDIGYSGVKQDCSDGYLTEALDGNRRIKLPHNNYTLLGIVEECISAPYAEEFSAEIVEKKYGNYIDYEVGEYHYGLAVHSFQTLMCKLDLKPTDYILRDDTDRI
jgi:hypothetical protein